MEQIDLHEINFSLRKTTMPKTNKHERVSTRITTNIPQDVIFARVVNIRALPNIHNEATSLLYIYIYIKALQWWNMSIMITSPQHAPHELFLAAKQRRFRVCMCSLWRQEKNNSFFPSKSGSIASAQNLDRAKSWSTRVDSTTCRQMRNTVVSYQQLVLPCTIINAATSLPDFTARELMEAFYIASKRNTCISQTHYFC